MKFFKKLIKENKLLLPIFGVTFLVCAALWLGFGNPRPLVQSQVLVEAGETGANPEIVTQALSSSLLVHPFSSTFKVTSSTFCLGSQSDTVLIYDRRSKTIDEKTWPSNYGEESREQHYLWSGVTDSAIHAAAQRRQWLEEVELEEGGKKLVISE